MRDFGDNGPIGGIVVGRARAVHVASLRSACGLLITHGPDCSRGPGCIDMISPACVVLLLECCKLQLISDINMVLASQKKVA